MSRFVNGVIIGIVVFLVVLSVFWYVMEASGDRQVESAAVETRWGETIDNATFIETKVTFANPHNFSVDMTRYEYELAVNGQRWDWGGQPLEQEVAAGGEAVVTFQTRFDHGRVTEWLRTHVDREEHTDAGVVGKAEFLVGNRNLDIEFNSNDDWETDLLGSLDEATPNCEDGAAGPCVEDAEHAWQVQGSTVVLKSRIGLHNPGEERIRVQNLTGHIHFNDVAVARAESYTTAILDPGATGHVDVFYYFDHDALVAWFPTHVDNCESSAVRVGLGSTYTVEPARAQEVTQSPSPTSSTARTPTPAPPTTPTTSAASTTTAPTSSTTPTTTAPTTTLTTATSATSPPTTTPTTATPTATTTATTPPTTTPTSPTTTTTEPPTSPATTATSPTTTETTPPTTTEEPSPTTSQEQTLPTTETPQGTTSEPTVPTTEPPTSSTEPTATTTGDVTTTTTEEPSPEASTAGALVVAHVREPPPAIAPLVPRILLPWQWAAAGPAVLVAQATAHADPPADAAAEESQPEPPDDGAPPARAFNWTFQPDPLETRFVCRGSERNPLFEGFDV